MAYTRTFTVNSSTYTAIAVQTVCQKIEVGEDAQTGTSDWYLSSTGVDGDKVTRPAGQRLLLERKNGFRVGEVVGYIKTSSGSQTFSQVESEG